MILMDCERSLKNTNWEIRNSLIFVIEVHLLAASNASKRSPFPPNITAQCICYSIIVSPQKEILVLAANMLTERK